MIANTSFISKYLPNFEKDVCTQMLHHLQFGLHSHSMEILDWMTKRNEKENEKWCASHNYQAFQNIFLVKLFVLKIHMPAL